MSYIDALYKKDEDKIYVVERDPKKGRFFVEYDARLAALANHADLNAFMQRLLGNTPELFQDMALLKNPGGREKPWHQDNAYWRCHPANLVSCWLTLDDVDASNGAMHLIPGSHLQGLGESHERSPESGALLDVGQRVDTSQAEVADLPAGGALFHHCQTLHYTPPNATSRQRRALAIHLLPPGTRSGHTGESLDVSYARPMLRMGF